MNTASRTRIVRLIVALVFIWTGLRRLTSGNAHDREVMCNLRFIAMWHIHILSLVKLRGEHMSSVILIRSRILYR